MKVFNKDRELRKLRFKQNKSKYIKLGTIILSVVILIIGIVYFSFARFESNEEFTIINAKVGHFQKSDVDVVSYVYDETNHDVPPTKESGYVIDEVSCTNADGEWNNDEWGLKLKNITGKVKCSLEFKHYNTLINYVTSLAESDNSLIFDATDDNNIRYIGNNAKNFIDVGETNSSGDKVLWRIIGVMNNVTLDNNEKTSLVKIIRSNAVDRIVYDTNNSNDWNTSSLKNYLNSGDYWNSLNDIVKNRIQKVKWNIGGSGKDVNAYMFYTNERGSNVSSGHNTIWTGNIALLYVSDYAFSTSGGSEEQRLNCLYLQMSKWHPVTSWYEDCTTNVWIDRNQVYTLTPNSASGSQTCNIWSTGDINCSFYADVNGKDYTFYSFPTLYLKNDIKLISGDGSESNPYILK